MKKSYLLASLFLISSFCYSQTDQSWVSNGVGTAFSALQTQTGLTPQSPCMNPNVPKEDHIDYFNDPILAKDVYRFYLYIEDNSNTSSGCNSSSTTRGRNEIRYDTGVPDIKVEYKWKMKIASDFKVTNLFAYNFCHFHQIKYKDGAFASQPMFTLTAESGAGAGNLVVISSPNDFSGDFDVVSKPLADFRGKWLEIKQVIHYIDGANMGKYGILITELGTGTVLMSFVDNTISTKKNGGGAVTALQQKWGIYRTKHTDLQDEEVLFDDFAVTYLDDTEPINFDPPAPVADFIANQTTVPEGTLVTFTDGSTNTPTGWNWTVTPATGWTYNAGSSATSQNPKITFNDAGSYTLALEVSNISGNNTITRTNYITVNGSASTEEKILNMGVYPNPFNNQLTIDLNGLEETITSIELVDISGRSVVFVQNPNGITIIDLINEATGIYFLNVKTENTSLTKKVIKL